MITITTYLMMKNMSFISIHVEAGHFNLLQTPGIVSKMEVFQLYMIRLLQNMIVSFMSVYFHHFELSLSKHSLGCPLMVSFQGFMQVVEDQI